MLGDEQGGAEGVGAFFAILMGGIAFEADDGFEVAVTEQMAEFVGDGGGELGVIQHMHQTAGDEDIAARPTEGADGVGGQDMESNAATGALGGDGRGGALGALLEAAGFQAALAIGPIPHQIGG